MGFRLVVEDVCWLGHGTRPVVRGAADQGVVRCGDRLQLSGPGRTTREVTVVALGLVDATRAPLVLLAIELAPDIGPGELLPGHVLLAVQPDVPLPQLAEAGAPTVPVLIGLPLDQALAAGSAAGLQVVGPDLDGPPLDAHRGTWVVTDQRPPGGARVPRGSAVTVIIRPDGGDETGVREPRRPRPDPGHLQAHLDRRDRSESGTQRNTGASPGRSPRCCRSWPPAMPDGAHPVSRATTGGPSAASTHQEPTGGRSACSSSSSTSRAGDDCSARWS